ncbi:hypothetical protein WOLCODRAFT_130602 [Wolfiporia cocos MD-104 SS10]|uniref:PQ-loop-domain-containing protein n=1 Tax=Wolfiporia cocos (strain MD-104) TaxID=742152 RepID=A0A2H3J8M9_WOLCO|nr:hypothetical protein WOLCODRAFT_130602 [Wolfiporia cocos MD-104 SS10]
MFGPMTLSDLLGYASIGSWLGAQFPQVIENIRRQSADGLALPFLLNWALGDATNLVGCVLTHQLPFQTWLASYFCFVDFTLLLQYFYYTLKAPSKPPFLSGRSRAASSATHRLSVEREATHYRALSSVAANVAAAAALAAEREQYASWHRERHSLERGPHTATAARGLTEAGEDEDDAVSEEGLARLADSFHSEGGRSARRKKVSWSRERYGSRSGSLGPSFQSAVSPTGRMHAPLHMTFQGSAEEQLPSRGRSLSREISASGEDEEWSASKRRSSRASRKGAGMVFLGVWALFGIGTLAGGQRGFAPSTELRTGRVLSNIDMAIPTVAEASPFAYSGSINVEDVAMPEYVRVGEEIPNDDPSKHPERSTEFIIGRISAWICTTLYLTSRLPQIWKNFVRKSVEGLSIYLFVFAFLGNFFYVASILTSPKLSLPPPQASEFIRESIPYLLGSGGTLMFDVTIVVQSFIYKPKAYSRGRHASRTIVEEEEALLSAGATGAEEPGTPSRRRTGASADSDLTAS